MASTEKYDRQLRLWGANGQKALMESKICLLNASATGTETLKNLVLPGCGNVTVVDPSVVSQRDLTNNFFFESGRLGQPRAQVALDLLLEMNDDVKGDFKQADPLDLIANEPHFFAQFSLVIATQLPEDVLLPLAAALYIAGVPLLVVRSYGLMGYLRVSVSEHTIVESKPDAQVEDLRIAHPFPALRSYVDAIDLSAVDDMVHGHVPYVALLVKAIDAWQAEQGPGTVPRKLAEKDAFKMTLRALARSQHEANFEEAIEHVYQAFVGAPGAHAAEGGDVAAAAARAYLSAANPDLRAVLEDPATGALTASSQPFWFVATAIRHFLFEEGALPVSGSLPDMTATTELYVSLQRVYQAKASADLHRVTAIVQQLVATAGAPAGHVPAELVGSMCRNARNLRVVRMRSVAREVVGNDISCRGASDEEVLENMRDQLDSGRSLMSVPSADLAPIAWYWHLRAADRFNSKHKRFPGTPLDSSVATLDSDATEIRSFVRELLVSRGLTAEDVAGVVKPEQADEITRYGAAELHAVASLMGGIAAQEAVKLLTHQYVPLNNTYVYVGIAGAGGVFLA